MEGGSLSRTIAIAALSLSCSLEAVKHPNLFLSLRLLRRRQPSESGEQERWMDGSWTDGQTDGGGGEGVSLPTPPNCLFPVPIPSAASRDHQVQRLPMHYGERLS